MDGMYPVSFTAVLLRLFLHRLLKNRMLNSGEVLALGLFEGGILYYALNESPAVGAGCFIGFGCRLLIEHMKAPDPVNVCCSLLGLALGILLSNVVEQLWQEAGPLFEDDANPRPGVRETIITRRRTHHSHTGTVPRRRVVRTQIPGAPHPDSASVQQSRRTNHNHLEQPVISQWEGLQMPIDKRIGLENEVMELRRRASAAAGETRRLQEEKKWAISDGNRAREFQLGLEQKKFQRLSEHLNRKAAEKVAIARGKSLLAKGGDIEIVGLSSAEAIDLTDRRLRSAKAAGDTYVRVAIPMQSLRLFGGNKEKAREVRPLLEAFLRGRHHSVIQDPSNNNYVIVSVDEYRSPSSTSAPVSDEWSRALD